MSQTVSNGSDSLDIPLPKFKLYGVILVLVVAAYFSLEILNSRFELHLPLLIADDKRPGIYPTICAIVLLPLAALIVPATVINVLKSKPAFSIDENGITISPLYGNTRPLIAWEYIENYKIVDRFNKKFIGINTTKPLGKIAKLSWIHSLMAKPEKTFMGFTVLLADTGQVPFEEVERLISKYHSRS
ncbi:STM3941 family protein [Hoeflea sp. TYP-13]|uniref:STM3941 family protein n=1 Tax=Hoeflea sp. TYP-13 TaxID=3230023 RepID=UPI0034C644B5